MTFGVWYAFTLILIVAQIFYFASCEVMDWRGWWKEAARCFLSIHFTEWVCLSASTGYLIVR
jgi:hypothetical protein